MNTDGTDAHLLIENGEHPAWSPDSKSIVFSMQDKKGWGIYLINRDGTGLRKISPDDLNATDPSCERINN